MFCNALTIPHTINAEPGSAEHQCHRSQPGGDFARGCQPGNGSWRRTNVSFITYDGQHRRRDPALLQAADGESTTAGTIGYLTLDGRLGDHGSDRGRIQS